MRLLPAKSKPFHFSDTFLFLTRCAECGDIFSTKGCYCERKERAKNRLLKDTFVTETGCWEWTKCKHHHGYADMSLLRRGKRIRLGHVIAYIVFIGEIPDGMELDHTCKNKTCVNPWHVEPVPHVLNVQRGRSMITLLDTLICKRGHQLTLNEIGESKSQYYCRICQRLRDRKRRAKQVL